MGAQLDWFAHWIERLTVMGNVYLTRRRERLHARRSQGTGRGAMGVEISSRSVGRYEKASWHGHRMPTVAVA